MVAIAAPIGGGLSDRFGQRVVGVPGALLFGTEALLFALETGLEPVQASVGAVAVMPAGARRR